MSCEEQRKKKGEGNRELWRSGKRVKQPPQVSDRAQRRRRRLSHKAAFIILLEAKAVTLMEVDSSYGCFISTLPLETSSTRCKMVTLFSQTQGVESDILISSGIIWNPLRPLYGGHFVSLL